MSFSIRFFAEVLDTTGATVVGSPLYNIISVSVTKTLDAAGQVTVILPANDERVIDLVSNERRLRIYEVDSSGSVVGVITDLLVQNITTAAQGEFPTQTLTGPDRLGELLYYNTQWRRAYDNVATTDIIGTTASGTGLLRDTGWTQGSVSPSQTPLTIRFDGQTVLAALLQLIRDSGDHIREGTAAHTLDYGPFGGAATVRCINVHHVLTTQTLPIISKITVNTISRDIENRMYPQGNNGFDLRDAPTSITDILVAAGRGPTGASTTSTGTSSGATISVSSVTGFVADGEVWLGDADDWTQAHEIATIASVGVSSLTFYNNLANTYSAGTDVIQNPQFYLEDTTSQTTYGIRESAPAFNWIGPGDSAADATTVGKAATSLYYATGARMERYAEAYQNYTLELLNFPITVRTGDKIRVTYKGYAAAFGGTLWLDIDAEYYVLSLTRNYTGDGRIITQAEVANVTRPQPNTLNLWVYNLETFSWITPR